MIHKNQLEILIEKRNDVNQWQNNGQLLGDDNIIMIKGPQICIIFDWDFDSYIIDHALPIKTNTNPTEDPFHLNTNNNDNNNNNNNNNNGILSNSNQYYEKAGLVYEDIRNIVKLTVHLELRENKEDYEEENSYYLQSNEPYY